LKEYKITAGLLDRPRKLVLTKDHIEFENKNLTSDLFTRFPKSDIVDFKRGLDRIVWYEFSVGYEYSLALLDKDNNTLEIKFRDYFGLHSNYSKFYSELTNLIWEYYFTDIVNVDLDEIYNRNDVELNGIKIGLNGIEFMDTREMLDWKNLDFKEYLRYFAVHKTDNSIIHRTFNFNEWNSERLFCLIRTVKKERGN